MLVKELMVQMKRAGTFIGEVWQLLHQHLPRPDPSQRWQLQLVASGAAGQPQVELRHVGVEGLQLGTTRPAAVHCRDSTQARAGARQESMHRSQTLARGPTKIYVGPRLCPGLLKCIWVGRLWSVNAFCLCGEDKWSKSTKNTSTHVSSIWAGIQSECRLALRACPTPGGWCPGFCGSAWRGLARLGLQHTHTGEHRSAKAGRNTLQREEISPKLT